MYLLSFFLPFLSFLILFFLSPLFGKRGTLFVSSFLMFGTFFVGCLLFFEVIFSGASTILDFNLFWLNYFNYDVQWSFTFDNLSVFMFLTVSFVSLIVHVYSFSYFYSDPYFSVFISYLSLFTFFMFLLILSGNLLLFFFAWEGVGLTSYLLVGFWTTRSQANKSSLKALFVNRIGDVFLFFAISLIAVIFETLDFQDIFLFLSSNVIQDTLNSNLFLNFSFFDFLCLLLFLAAVSKSAQIGLHTWLPDAMEGPTPVSALIHAATMVTAGVFLILRMSPFFMYSFKILSLISFWGALTAFFAGVVALFQNDIKKIIAYSTCSQLGYMLFGCGLAHFSVAFFHLVNHACFKALLFLTAGSILHALADEQDIRKMGSLLRILPLSYMYILIGSFALIAFPFISGFYSKDLLLENALNSSDLFVFLLALIFGTVGAFFTSFYSMRLIILVFFQRPMFPRAVASVISEPTYLTLFILSFLFFSSVIIGFFFFRIFTFLDSFLFAEVFFLSSNIFIPFSYFEYSLNILDLLLPLGFSFLGLFFSILYYWFFPIFFRLFFNYSFYSNADVFLDKFINLFFLFRAFSSKRWFIDNVYNVFNFFILTYANLTIFNSVDRGFFDFLFSRVSVFLIFNISYFYNYLFQLRDLSLFGFFFFQSFFFSFLIFFYLF